MQEEPVVEVEKENLEKVELTQEVLEMKPTAEEF